MLPVSKERNRFRSITWENYDPLHQKYLEIGKTIKLVVLLSLFYKVYISLVDFDKVTIIIGLVCCFNI